jgi:hypothetical protein
MKPRFDLDGLHIAEFVVAPLKNNPTPQIDHIAFLGGVLRQRFVPPNSRCSK